MKWLTPFILVLSCMAAGDISVTMISPANGSTVSGNIILAAQTSPNVSKVEFYIDGVLFKTIYHPLPVQLDTARPK